MIDETEARDAIHGSAYAVRGYVLPRHLLDALDRFRRADILREFLGNDFSAVYLEAKNSEYEAYNKLISAWEREQLLFNV